MNHSRPWGLRSQRVIAGPDSEACPATLIIADGKIADVLGPGATLSPDVTDVRDVGNLVVMPGVVDTHAHINEPGRTDWEGFQSATRAAAAGGITTVVDMPLNSIPATTSLDALKIKAETAREKCLIDYGFWGGVIPGNSGELQRMVEHGALGFKAFLCESGVAEFPMSRESDLRETMPILVKAGVPLLVHAELETPAQTSSSSDPRDYQTYLDSRPKHWEVDAVRMMIRLASETGCRVHIVHLSAADALSDLSEAQRRGVPITAETCPHYLYFEAEGIHQGATPFKCAPPIRERANREKLWKGVSDSVIEFIVSDHSPCTTHLKVLESGDFSKAWGGISGLQFSLPVVWTEMRKRGFSLGELVRRMSFNTARFAGLSKRKGELRVGSDADFVVWDPEAEFTVRIETLFHKNKLTPYTGRTLNGVVHETFVRGHSVFKNGEFPPGLAPGAQIFRNQVLIK